MQIEHLKKEMRTDKNPRWCGDDGGLKKELEVAQKECAALQAQLKSLGCDDSKEEQLQKVHDPINCFSSVNVLH